MSKPRKRIILGAFLGGVNHHTIWSGPAAGSQIGFSSFRHLAQAAERGKFDFLFLGEGVIPRERLGQISDQDVIARSDTLPMLAAIAAVTEHLGLIGTVNAALSEPYEMARQLALLDYLSGGRAGWNVVTSFDSFSGENFRRGGFLHRDDRYTRAGEFLELARQLWGSWPAGAIIADKDQGRFLRDAGTGAFSHNGSQFDVSWQFNVPRSPQGRPVVLQAGVSPQERDFAAANADAIFSPCRPLGEARAFYQDIGARAARQGRSAGAVKLLPSVSFTLGDSKAEALERHREITHAQVSGKTAQILLEAVWNRDLSGYDPDGPLPDIDPDPDGPLVIEGRAHLDQDAHQTVREWRALANAHHYTLRELAIHLFSRSEFIGTPRQVADRIDSFVQNDGSDGFIIGSHPTATGLDEFVDRVVPLLQERGSLRADYTGTTLRDNLGIPVTGPAVSATVA